MFKISGNASDDLFNLEQDYLRLKNYALQFLVPYAKYHNANDAGKGASLSDINEFLKKLNKLHDDLKEAMQAKSGKVDKIYNEYCKIRGLIVPGMPGLESVNDDEFKSTVKRATVKDDSGTSAEEDGVVNKMKTIMQASAIQQYYVDVYRSLDGGDKKVALAAYMLKLIIEKDGLLQASQGFSKDSKQFALSKKEMVLQFYKDEDSASRDLLAMIDLNKRADEIKQQKKNIFVELNDLKSVIDDLKDKIRNVPEGDSSTSNADNLKQLKDLEKRENSLKRQIRKLDGDEEIIGKLNLKRKSEVKIFEILNILSDDDFDRFLSRRVIEHRAGQLEELRSNPSLSSSANSAFTFATNILFNLSNMLRKFTDDPHMSYKSVTGIQNEICERINRDLDGVKPELTKAFNADMAARIMIVLTHMLAKQEHSKEAKRVVDKLADFVTAVNADPNLKDIYRQAVRFCQEKEEGVMKARAGGGSSLMRRASQMIRRMSLKDVKKGAVSVSSPEEPAITERQLPNELKTEDEMARTPKLK